jgi:hypothetical protein
MRTVFNEMLRWLIGVNMVMLGKLFARIHQKKLRSFERRQKQLLKLFKIDAQTPILSYGDKLKEHIQTAAQRHKCQQFAVTSGSTAEPKRILYPDARIRRTKFVFIDNLGRCFNTLKFTRKVLYVFSALQDDDSLTGMLLDENKGTPYISGLQAPYRLHRQPALRALTQEYGSAALRLWMLALSNPGIIYSTNPSTLSTFLDALDDNFQEATSLIKDYCESPEKFSKPVHALRKRVQSWGWEKRFRRLASSPTRPSYQEMFPAFRTYFCWTGGYVQPFIDRIETRLPPEEYRRIPMYSMSTETVETVAHYSQKSVHFIPLGPYVLYEFLPIESEDHPENLLKPHQLQVNQQYTMVVSDDYGLKRYQTDDVFECRGFVQGLPDLHFLRRRSLEYSFTGEKLTGPQLSGVYQKLRNEFSFLTEDTFLTCIPSLPRGSAIPHYKFVIVGDQFTAPPDLITRFDALLQEANEEYAHKRDSDRIGPAQLMQSSLDEIVAKVSSSSTKTNWESQFKFLPLYRRTWEHSGQ